jgi:hypothetical protein
MYSVLLGDNSFVYIPIPVHIRRALFKGSLLKPSIVKLGPESARRIRAGISIPPRNFSPWLTDYTTVCARRIPEVLSRGFRSRSLGAEISRSHVFGLKAGKRDRLPSLPAGHYFSIKTIKVKKSQINQTEVCSTEVNQVQNTEGK